MKRAIVVLAAASVLAGCSAACPAPEPGRYTLWWRDQLYDKSGEKTHLSVVKHKGNFTQHGCYTAQLKMPDDSIAWCTPDNATPDDAS